MPDLSPEAQKLLDARKAAVEELRAIDNVERPITDHDVLRLSAARMFSDSLTLRMVSGDPVAAAEVRAADDIVQNALASFARQIKVEVEIVEGIVGICPKCKAEIADYRAPPKPKAPPPVLDAVVADAPESQRALPKPHPNDLPRENPGSIHDARLPNGQPARMQRNDYSALKPNGYDPHQSAPDWSASHPWPIA